MRKIEINLYPHKNTETKKVIILMERYFPVTFLVFFTLILINIILLFFIISFSFSYHSLNRKWINYTPQIKVINSLKSELETLRVREKEYQNLASHVIKTSHSLADIFESLPQNIWLDQINLSEDYMSFTGYVVRWKEDYLTSVDSFIKNLKKQSYFSTIFKNIILKSSRKTELEGVEVVKFEVECGAGN